MSPEEIKRGITRKMIYSHVVSNIARKFSIREIVIRYNKLTERVDEIFLDPNDNTVTELLNDALKKNIDKS